LKRRQVSLCAQLSSSTIFPKLKVTPFIRLANLNLLAKLCAGIIYKGKVMSVFVNVLEEIVVKEVHNQIAELRSEIQYKINVGEVTAYCLNRLPPLFATSMKGWHHQHDYALTKLQPKIYLVVKHGIQTVLLGDPLHRVTPVHNHLFVTKSGALHQLVQILRRKYLRWRDVPALVEEIVDKSAYLRQINNCQDITITQASEGNSSGYIPNLNRTQQALLAASKRSIDRQLAQKKILATELSSETVNLTNGYTSGGDWSVEKKSQDLIEMEYRALESYTLQAKLGLVNVLEHLVFMAIEQTTTAEIYKKINRDQVATYALNRLPPMYATTVRGFRHLRRKAISDLSRELVGEVRNGVIKVLLFSYSDTQPIYAHQFTQEYQEAMVSLRNILGRSDINLKNIVAIVRELKDSHMTLSRQC